MTREEIQERLGIDDEAILMDGFDDCVVGAVEQFGRPRVVAYDVGKVLAKLQADGMSYEEAEEFWSFNQLGAYVGDYTPVFIVPLEMT